MKPQAYIVDIDGTMAIKGDREPFEWDAVECDTPNTPVVRMVQAMAKAGISVIFCSGRMEQARPGTTRWLAAHYGHHYEMLLMRADGDYRKDSVVKEEIYRERIEPFYNIMAVIDDRTQVVDMWRDRLGLVCFQVAKGDF